MTGLAKPEPNPHGDCDGHDWPTGKTPKTIGVTFEGIQPPLGKPDWPDMNGTYLLEADDVCSWTNTWVDELNLTWNDPLWVLTMRIEDPEPDWGWEQVFLDNRPFCKTDYDNARQAPDQNFYHGGYAIVIHHDLPRDASLPVLLTDIYGLAPSFQTMWYNWKYDQGKEMMRLVNVRDNVNVLVKFQAQNNWP